MAYLVSQYPTLSMIFVIREVLQLRERGFRIDVASINDPDRAAEAMAAMERAEVDRTFYVLRQGVRGALWAHLKTLCLHPMGYWRGWSQVFSLGKVDARRLFMSLAYFTEALLVGHWMVRSGQQHLHVHLGSQAATVGLFTRTVFGVRFSMTVHGPDEFYDAQGQYLAEKIAAADFIVCISHFARSQLMKLSPYEHWHKLHVSRLGVDPSVFSPVWQPHQAGRPFEVLCVGRLTPAKGQHLLIEAISRLRAQGRNVVLRLVGGGTDEASLRRQAAALNLGESVVFQGPVNQDNIRTFYGKADCFSIPSFAEGIPVVLMEAMSMGIPCVTTHVNGIPELIQNAETGLLVAPSDVDGLAKAIARLMDEPQLALKISVAGREQVTTRYHIGSNADHLAALFSGLLLGK
jgi:colanic acid/amylovoran biosynthesis glycosyltransferase